MVFKTGFISSPFGNFKSFNVLPKINIWLSSKKITFFVCFTIPDASDATKNSLFPKPAIRGEPFFAAIISFETAFKTTIALRPFKELKVSRTDDANPSFFKFSSIK